MNKIKIIEFKDGECIFESNYVDTFNAFQRKFFPEEKLRILTHNYKKG